MLEENIEKLKLDKVITDFLERNRIIKVRQLTNKTKTELKDLGLQVHQISKIEVKLQLEGLELATNNKKTGKRRNNDCN